LRDAVLTMPEIVEEILGQASRRPQAVALEEVSGHRISYERLARDVDAVASGLLQRGLRPGDSVLFTIPPSIASITLILALVRAGATIVAADPRMGAAVFASRLNLVRPAWVMADSRVYTASSHPVARALLRSRGLELPQLAAIEARHVRVGPRLPGVPASVSLDELRSTSHAGLQPHAPATDVRIVLFTSGTTAAPKAVVHDERSIGASMEMLRDQLQLTAGDVVFSSELYLNVPALMAGARSVMTGFARVDPRRWLRQARTSGATVAFAVPSDMVRIVESAGRDGEKLPRGLRLLLLGSAPAHRQFLERLRAVVEPSTAVWSVYAMTEMLPVSAIAMNEKLETDSSGDLVGRPFPGVRLRVADDGELFVSGPNLFRGYMNEGDVKEHATGDLVALDEQGRVVILGRKKQMIIRGRDNIYPSLVESVVDSIPGVRRSCLCGYYDETRADERLVLVLEPAAGEDSGRLIRRVRNAIVAGATRIDANAFPDDIVVMQLPVDARSRKTDRAAVSHRLAQMIT
jgi:acyl-CoA synthetase (AMP-forming)/AMP-acid ligase II